MSLDDVRDALADGGTRNKWIGVWVGVLAALLAVCTMGGDNAAKDANRANIDASNKWAFFQAKNIRRHELRLQTGEFEVLLASNQQLPDVARKLIDEKIAKYRKDEARLTSEPETGEGLNELLVKGKALEVQRDRAMLKDPFFDYGQALLQVAIVLASIAIITGGTSLLVLSGLMAALGIVSTLNGFFLFFGAPFI